jgi:hypothetical protein
MTGTRVTQAEESDRIRETVERRHDPNLTIDIKTAKLARQRSSDLVAVNRPAEPVVPAAGRAHIVALERLQDRAGSQTSKHVKEHGVVDDHHDAASLLVSQIRVDRTHLVHGRGIRAFPDHGIDRSSLLGCQ